MIRQNILTLLALASVLAGAVGCKDREDYTGPNAIERIDNQVQSTKAILVGAEHGWEMSIYPEDDVRSFGGFTSLVKFNNDGTMSAASELNHSGADYPVEDSYYSLNATNGATLSFETYNENVHLYSSPGRVKYSAFVGASPRTGAKGDFNFRIIKATADSVILRGIRDDKRVVLTPLKTADWSEHLYKITNSYRDYYTSRFTLSGEGVETTVKMAENRRHISIDGYGDDLPIRYTADGFELYEPIVIRGKRVQRFYISGNPEDMTFKTDGDAMTLEANVLSVAELLNSRTWVYNKITSMGRTREGITTLDNRLRELARTPEVKIVEYSIGLRDGQFGAYVRMDISSFIDGWTPAQGPLYETFPIPLVMTDLGNNAVEMRYAPETVDLENGNGRVMVVFSFPMAVKGFSNIGKVTSGARTLIDEELGARRFTGVIDNAKRPRKITLTDQDDSNNVIELKPLE